MSRAKRVMSKRVAARENRHKVRVTAGERNRKPPGTNPVQRRVAAQRAKVRRPVRARPAATVRKLARVKARTRKPKRTKARANRDLAAARRALRIKGLAKRPGTPLRA
jgi:hypothetical protein